VYRYAHALLSHLAESFFSPPFISSLRAANFGSGHSDRRIRSRAKAKVVATVLTALNMMAGAHVRSRISGLRHCDLISLRHTHVGDDVLTRKTRCALRTRAPIGFARLLVAILALTALASAPVRAQDVTIDPTTRPVVNIPNQFLVPGAGPGSGTNTITGTLSIGTSHGAGTLNITTLNPPGGNVKAESINIGGIGPNIGSGKGALNITNGSVTGTGDLTAINSSTVTINGGGSLDVIATHITMGSTLENTIGPGPLLTTALDVETGGNVQLLQGGKIIGNTIGALFADAGGSIILNGTTVIANSPIGVELHATAATLTNVNITNQFGIGLDVIRKGPLVTMNGGTITTATSTVTGQDGWGVYSDTEGRVNVSNVTINTTGERAIGVLANTLIPASIGDFVNTTFGPGSITLSGGSIVTTGANAIGALASGSASENGGQFPASMIVIQKASILTELASAVAAVPFKSVSPDAFEAQIGANTGGIVILDNTIAKAGFGGTVSAPVPSGAMVSGGLVQDGGQLTIQNNSSLEGTSDGITLTNSAGNTNGNTVVVDNSTLIADAGDALKLQDAVGATITVSNLNNTIHTESGNLINSIGSTAVFNIENSTLTGNIVADSASTVDVNLLNNSTLTAVINGAHNVLIDPSTWIMPNNSSITGDLTLRGNLIINSVAKFAATGQASVLTIGRNLVMGSGSTTALGIGGLDGNQYDRLAVGGNAAVSGNLVVSSLGGFHPSAGNAFQVLHTNGTVSGNFSLLNDSAFNTTPGTITGHLELTPVEVVAPNGVVLVYVKESTEPPVSPGRPEQPPIVVDPEPLPPVNPDKPIPEEEVVRFVNPTVEELTSLYEIGFSAANMQRFNLGDRMFQIQQGMTGFVSPITPAPLPPPTGKEITEGKGAEGKAPPPAPQPVPTNRWGVWANGWGDFVHLDGTNFANGYGFTTGGMSTGVDYLITDHFAVGLFGGYSHTWVNFTPSGNATVNTGRGGLYATYFQQGWWINAAVWGGGNSYSTSRQAVAGQASGETDGYEISTFGDAGYDFHCGDLSFGPTVSMQYTDVHLSGFGEHGSLIPLDIHGDSQDSLRTDVGGQAYYRWHVGSIPVIPNLRLAWEHEYFYSNLPITATAPILNGATATFSGPNEGRDSLIINANIAVQWTPRIWTTIGYDGQLARNNYSSNAVTGTFSFNF
jgi:uncharacterized protein with beta-barrel porin domain